MHNPRTTQATRRASPIVLTDAGERQADLLAARIEEFSIDLLYVSPMRRTLQTASPVAAATGLQARVFTGLHEWGGVYEDAEDGHIHQPGLGRAEMEMIIPDLVVPEEVTAAGWWQGDLDVSRMEAVIERSRSNAAAYLDYLASEYPPDLTIGVVTHGGFGSHLLEAALHVEAHPDFFLRFLQANTGHALIEITEEERVLRWHNRTDHLPADLITF
ncbi:MAG: histidine phosphatase family protein [Thermomicrobiales bacterium]